MKTIDEWRVTLAKTIAKNNKDLETYDINYAVQKLIDRIIFLRFAEDKGIETYGSLREFLGTKEKVYPKLDEFFRKADTKYNSSLFKPEEHISKLEIEAKILHSIIRDIYPDKCPYEFSVMPIEVLGSIYEKFLGKTIRLTASHQAKVEEKPEVRKAGGVYYTPQYIVDYIVENTVGEKLKGRKPEDFEQKTGGIHKKGNAVPLSLNILDPACGSGSFLVRAYDHLLNWYLKQYAQKQVSTKNEREGKIYKASRDTYRLSIPVKQEILKRHIYGVDIDRQAVEVTKLSLLLKLMEGESDQTAAGFLRFDQAQLLPDLSTNIKCGNSLIGGDFYESKNLSLFATEEKMKINVFEWGGVGGFPEIMKSGGFDCVIGNPPYVQILHKSNEILMNYFKSKYNSVDSFKKNMFPLFIEKAIILASNESSRISMIIPDRFFFTPSYASTRKTMLEETKIEEIVEIPSGAFSKAIVGNAIFTLNKPFQKNYNIKIKHAKEKGDFCLTKETSFDFIYQHKARYAINLLLTESTERLLEEVQSKSYFLKELANCHVGMMVKNNAEKFLNHKLKGFYPIVKGKQVYRYKIKSKSYFDFNDITIFGGTKNPDKHKSKPKLLLRKTGNVIHCSVDFEGIFAEQSVYLVLPETTYTLLFLAGVLNSQLIGFLYRSCFITNPEAYPYIQHYDLEKLPIPKLDLSSPDQKNQHDRMVSLVDQMLTTQKRLHETNSPIEKKQYQQEADILDKQIDALVYELYELTPEEIRIVEGEGRGQARINRHMDGEKLNHHKKKIFEVVSKKETCLQNN